MKRIIKLIICCITVFGLLTPSTAFASSYASYADSVGNEEYDYDNPDTRSAVYLGIVGSSGLYNPCPNIYVKLFRRLAITSHDEYELTVPETTGRDTIRNYLLNHYEVSAAVADQCMQVLQIYNDEDSDPSNDMTIGYQRVKMSQQDFRYEYFGKICTTSAGYGILYENYIYCGLDRSQPVGRIINFSVAENITISDKSKSYRKLGEAINVEEPGYGGLEGYANFQMEAYCEQHVLQQLTDQPHVGPYPCGGYCTICGGELPDTATPHVYDRYIPDKGGSFHYLACKCGTKSGVSGDHDIPDNVWRSNGPEGEIRRCSYCDYSRPVVDYRPHNPDSRTFSGPIKDSQEGLCYHQADYCSDCDYVYEMTNVTEHEYSNCTSLKCDNCDYKRPVAPGHVYANRCSSTCENCIYGYRTPPHDYTDCLDTTCNGCGHTRTALQHSPISATLTLVDVKTAGVCQELRSECANCLKTFVVSTDTTHAWTDCADEYCNSCLYHRTAPGHSYTYGPWIDVATESTCEKQFVDCVNCSYSYWANDSTHTWSNGCDTACGDCGYTRTVPPHSYTYAWVDVSTSGTCKKLVGTCTICGYSTVSAYDYAHAYTDCADSACNDCGYARTAPGHSYTFGPWTDVTTESTCEKQLVGCANCSYSNWNYDTTHAWSNGCDTACGDCGYTRTVPPHSYTYAWVDVSTSGTCKKLVGTCTVCGVSTVSAYDYVHIYTDCADSTCNDCGYIRTAPGHSYSYGSWVDVATSGTCEKQLRECANCSYSYWYYDTTHAWSSDCDTVCNDCGYARTVPAHTYKYAWVDVRTSGTCEKYVATCSKCGYSYIVSYDYTHAYTNSSDRVCNDCGYTRP